MGSEAGSKGEQRSRLTRRQEDILVKYLADSLQAVHEGLASTSGRAGTALGRATAMQAPGSARKSKAPVRAQSYHGPGTTQLYPPQYQQVHHHLQVQQHVTSHETPQQQLEKKALQAAAAATLAAVSGQAPPLSVAGSRGWRESPDMSPVKAEAASPTAWRPPLHRPVSAGQLGGKPGGGGLLIPARLPRGGTPDAVSSSRQAFAGGMASLYHKHAPSHPAKPTGPGRGQGGGLPSVPRPPGQPALLSQETQGQALTPGAAAARGGHQGPGVTSGQGAGGRAGGGGGLPPTEALVRQLPVAEKPRQYRHVPSEAATHAEWWKWKPPTSRPYTGTASVLSYPRTAVTDRESVSPTEYAAWEARMNDLEKTLEEERARRHRFEEELKQLTSAAAARGSLTTGGVATAGVHAGAQQAAVMKQALATR